MARVALPAVPGSGRDLEEYVAGLFQSAGWFVERNVRRRDAADVLELDAVATRYDGPRPRSVLAEVKGGRWGFGDVFKVAGWMQLLGIERGAFFVKERPAATSREQRAIRSAVRRTLSPLRVSLVDLGDFSDPAARFGEGGFAGRVDPVLLEVWRYSYRAERALLESLRVDRRERPERAGPLAVLRYHDLVNDHAFFIDDPAKRLLRLYEARRAHPKLSAAVAAELDGGDFHASVRGSTRARGALADALFAGEHPTVQASLHVEHRARLAVLKAAIDAPRAARGRAHERWLATLPASFRGGLRRLEARPSFRRYALLWQVFLWGFGGFYLADREDEELGLLALQTGIPRSEIGDALRAFDDLFPLPEGSWIVPLANSPVRLVRMVPTAFRGVGAVQRLRRHGARDYDALAGGSVARRSLVAWHNALVRLLAANER